MRVKSLLFLLVASLCNYLLVGQTSYSYPQNSVLATGNWYKLAIKETGIYKLTYNDLSNMGVNVSNLNSANIAIFGNGGGMLPTNINGLKANDLQENAIYVADGGDGKFNAGDYILFYAESPNSWTLDNNNLFQYKTHAYSTDSYYFLTIEQGIGTARRIEITNETPLNITDTITTFVGRRVNERELENPVKRGRNWLGEKFTAASPTIPFLFNFPNIVQGSPVQISVILAGQSTNSNFVVKVNDQQIGSINTSVGRDYAPDAIYATEEVNKTIPATSASFNISITYNNLTELGDAFLDKITINALQNLIFTGEQMGFRSLSSIGNGKCSKFVIKNTSSQSVVWNVTDPIHPVKMNTTLTGGELSFITPTDSLKEFVIFNGNTSLTPTFVEKVVNQNLHALPQTDYVIVTHPEFEAQAERLAQLHRLYNGLTVTVVTTNQVYNEFSSGMQDPVAIRYFMKMFFDRATSPAYRPQYLLLFGSTTYDPKNIEKNGSRNKVVTSQTLDGCNAAASDDIFGSLDNSGVLNIGIGRFPASNVTEANILVDKTENYMFKKDITEQNIKGNWRNVVCLIADDPEVDRNGGITTFSPSSENFLAFKLKSYPNICVEKIYADAYKQTSTAVGTFYPEATKAINNRMISGCLLLNYVGHGSPSYLGHERYITESDILLWKNKYSLPIFIANTCSFARFDYTDKASGAEIMLLNPNGGSIASIAPTRDVGSDPDLNSNFFVNALNYINDQPPAMGDIIRITKNTTNAGEKRSYVLIGDPALKISLPQNKVRTTKINKKEISSEADTLMALSNVQLEGEITDEQGNILSDFDGILYPTIYDKPINIKTLGNEGENTTTVFSQQKNIIYKGKTNVSDGKFSFSFIVPRDIAYNYDYGKISYYAQSASLATDACGNYRDVVFGGIDETVHIEESYPEIRLFLNDTNFKRGGITDENPTMLAFIADKFGVNTVGSGIGHDITAILDGKVNDEILLNDYFDIDALGRGVIKYPFTKLKPGKHTLLLKAWNIFNYSAIASLEFEVQSSEHLEVGKLKNSPNPFKGSTIFTIEHNMPEGVESAQIHIFNTTGQLIKLIDIPIIEGSYVLGPVEFNANEKHLTAGVYLSRIIIKAKNGDIKTVNQKLVLLP